jgi:amidase
MATYITRFDHSGPSALRVAVKDLIDMVGVPTTSGSRVIAATAAPAASDAPCLAGTRAAEAAGEATVVGKTNLHELAFGVTGINPWFGTPVNPLDARLVPGGSSSGSAVAVASGEADVAFGSDTGGSIRIPAACCGVVGLKTTRGRIPLDGVRPLAPSLDTVGPMGATVAAVVTGMTLLEPAFAPTTRDRAHGRAGRPDLIGRVRLPADARIDDAIDAALRAAGLVMVDVELPGWDAATAAAMTILGAEAWQVHADLWREHGDELSPDVGARLARSSAITAADLAAAWQQGRRWDAELAGVLAGVDALALPTLAAAPPTLEEGDRMTEIRYAAPFNLAGVPALSLPVASGAGLPASLQLVAPAHSEALLLAIAADVEAAGGPPPMTA